MDVVRPVMWTLRFLTELVALAAFAIGGWALASGPLRLVLAVGLPVIAAIIWGLWMAPKSSRRLRDPVRLVVEIVFFLAAAVAVVIAGYSAAGIALALGAIAVAVAVRHPSLIPPGQADL